MWRSGKVERLLSLSGRNQQFLSHDLDAGVVRQLQVVDAGHDGRQEVVGVLRRLERLPHDRQRGIEAPKPCGSEGQKALLEPVSALSRAARFRHSPPTGSRGLPVTNCRNSRCCSASKLLNTSNRKRTARLRRQCPRLTL